MSERDYRRIRGALLLTTWRAPVSRPTMDIDLAGQTNNQPDHIKEVVGAICEGDVEPEKFPTSPNFLAPFIRAYP